MTGGADEAQRAAFDAKAAEIRAIEDPVAAFEAAGEWVETQSAYRGEAAQIRAELARRVQESGDMSVTQLARHLKVTKQRASELLKRAREGDVSPR